MEPLIVGTVVVIVVIVAGLLLWGVRNVVSIVVNGGLPPSKEPCAKKPKMTVTPSINSPRTEGPPRLHYDLETFTPSLTATGQMIDDPTSCTVWNINSTRPYSFTTPGLATHPGSTPENPKCILNIEGGATSLLLQGRPTCAAQPNQTNWINPLIPVTGGAVRRVQNEAVNSLDQCVVELDPNHFNSYSAFDYAVGNAGAVLASGAIQKASNLNSEVSDLTTSTNQLVALTQNISMVENEVKSLSSQIAIQQAANSNLQNEYSSRITAIQGLELAELTVLDSNLITLQTQFSASNAYLSQLLGELSSNQSALSNLNLQLSQADTAARKAHDALAQSALLPTSGNAPVARTTGPQTATTFGNNGSVSCSVYCAGISGNSWNGELPDSWQGASCVGTGTPGVNCDTVNGSQINCMCTPTGKGWNQDPAPWNHPASPSPSPPATTTTTSGGLHLVPKAGSYASIPSQGPGAHGYTISGYGSSQTFPNTSANGCYWKNVNLKGDGYITNEFVQGQSESDTTNTCTVVFNGPPANVCQTTPLVQGGCVNACQAAFGAWANGDNKVNIGSPGNGGICSCTTPSGCSLPAGFSQ
jgi:hypothetical protein